MHCARKMICHITSNFLLISGVGEGLLQRGAKVTVKKKGFQSHRQDPEEVHSFL